MVRERSWLWLKDKSGKTNTDQGDEDLTISINLTYTI